MSPDNTSALRSEAGGFNSDNYEDRFLLDLAPCSLLEVYRRCEGTYYRHTTRLHDVTYYKVVISSDFFSWALFCMYNVIYIYIYIYFMLLYLIFLVRSQDLFP